MRTVLALIAVLFVSVGNANDMQQSLRLTRPDGTVVYVNPRAIAFVRAPLPGENGNATIVFSYGGKQGVTETVEQILKDLKESSGAD